MIRIVGILCGSALAIALLIIVLGLPEFQRASTTRPGLQTEVATIEEPAVAAEPVEAEPVPVPPAPIESAPIEQAPMEQVAVDETADQILEELPVQTSPTTPPAENWFAFWSPFRSELAANGFITQLQRETGMDYRVVKVKPGVFEVAFAYEGEADIETKLATISRATGLEMPDG